MGDSVRHKSISKKTRQLVLEKYDCHCAYCGKILDIKTLRVDHLEAFRNGGADDVSNYMPACQSCNFYKSTLSLEKFREQLKTISNAGYRSPAIIQGANTDILRLCQIKRKRGLFSTKQKDVRVNAFMIKNS